jgi:hypothetical protein
MKIINLNESQYQRLFELSAGVSGLGDENPTSVPEDLPRNQIFTTQPIHTKDGEQVPGNEPDTQDFADTQTPQQWGSVAGRKSSNTI